MRLRPPASPDEDRIAAMRFFVPSQGLDPASCKGSTATGPARDGSVCKGFVGEGAFGMSGLECYGSKGLPAERGLLSKHVL